ncbi:unnamed protein product [Gordionus sp. m RMFG-2023]|uniref:ER membrane protein complex subunit 4-like n=1 Tax=Gordionus sp. m RMFG-2023 TaxID=3053472 RepID=UPI0030DE0CDA
MTTNRLIKRHKWHIDLRNIKPSDKISSVLNQNLTIADIPSPNGFNSSYNLIQEIATNDADPALIVKRSWEIALGSVKKIPMNMFIMYMSGNSISLFPIMVVGMLFMGPIKALFGIKATFNMIEGNQAGIQKIIYFLGNIGNILLALYKCASMGLLPTHPSDWLAFVQLPQQSEYSGGGFVLH